MMDAPLVRLTLDHMRHSIVAAFSRHADDMKGAVEEAVKAAIEQFDFKAEVSKLAQAEMGDQLRAGIKRALWDSKVQAAIHAALARQARGRS